MWRRRHRGAAGHDTEGGDGFTGPVRGWRLDGADLDGNRVSLFLSEETLWQIHPGLTIGRHPMLCDLVLEEGTVSRRHFRVSRQGEELLVEDLNSLNGTYLDGARLEPFEPIRFAAGQTLVVGHLSLSLSRA